MPEDGREPADDAYRTIEGRGEARFEIRGSEFLCHASPARTTDEAESFVESVREEYDDATHNVPAYRVRAGESTPGGLLLREYQRDDGEPTGSAGKPALNVLQQREIANAVVVITRYYGGTNLGVGGLARAYARGAKEAIDDAGVVEREPHDRVVVEVAYDDSGTVRGILESAGVDFEAEYEERARFEAWVPRTDAPGLRDRLRSATSGRGEVE